MIAASMHHKNISRRRMLRRAMGVIASPPLLDAMASSEAFDAPGKGVHRWTEVPGSEDIKNIGTRK
jgi:hypothetical protein